MCDEGRGASTSDRQGGRADRLDYYIYKKTHKPEQFFCSENYFIIFFVANLLTTSLFVVILILGDCGSLC